MTSKKVKTLPYRPCVGIFLLNAEGLVWIGRRIRKPHDETDNGAHVWQMPQGGIDKGEDPLTAAKRELHEETGITSVEIVAECEDWLTYDLPPELIGRALKGRFRGQLQKWYAMRFIGHEAEIDIAEKPGHKAEFDAWRWAQGHELPDLIVPFKRDVYRQVITNFEHLFDK